MSRAPSAVLFDFDGVIADSRASHHAAWRLAFGELFGAPLDTQALRSGLASSEIARRLASEAGQPARSQQLYDLKLQRLLEASPPKMLPGVRELMQLCKSRAIPYGIVSNAPGAFVRRNVAHFELEVPCVLGLDDVSAPKPSGAPYLELAQRLGLSPAEHAHAWVLEDSLTGVQAGLAADMRVLGITSQHTAEQLRQAGASDAYESCAGVHRSLSDVLRG